MSGHVNFKRLVASDAEVQTLFDTGEIEHVCNLVRNQPDAVVGGMRRYLLEPLERVIDSLYRDGENSDNSEFQGAAVALMESATNVCRIIDLNALRCPESALELSEILAQGWSRFVLMGSASSLYHDLPKQRQQKKKAAKKPRQKDPMRAAIIAVMHKRKPHCEGFKTFMAGWECGHIDGLTATPIEHKEKYTIADENGDRGRSTYSWGSLQTMYSRA